MNVLDRIKAAEARDMAPGQVYVLTCDVDNPKPDRRMSHDWRAAPVIKTGARFHIVCHQKDSPRPAGALELHRVGWWSHQRVHLNHDLWPALEPHLQHVEATLGDLVEQFKHQATAEEVLELLIARTAITLVDVHEAMVVIAERAE